MLFWLEQLSAPIHLQDSAINLGVSLDLSETPFEMFPTLVDNSFWITTLLTLEPVFA